MCRTMPVKTVWRLLRRTSKTFIIRVIIQAAVVLDQHIMDNDDVAVRLVIKKDLTPKKRIVDTIACRAGLLMNRTNVSKVSGMVTYNMIVKEDREETTGNDRHGFIVYWLTAQRT